MTLEDLRAPIEEEKRLDRVLDRLTESARKTIPAAMAASVSPLVDEDQTAWTPTATDETAAAIDKLVPHANRARAWRRRAPSVPYVSASMRTVTDGRRKKFRQSAVQALLE